MRLVELFFYHMFRGYFYMKKNFSATLVPLFLIFFKMGFKNLELKKNVYQLDYLNIRKSNLASQIYFYFHFDR